MSARSNPRPTTDQERHYLVIASAFERTGELFTTAPAWCLAMVKKPGALRSTKTC